MPEGSTGPRYGARSEGLHHALIVLFVVVAYWPLSSFNHTARWDAIDGYFPFRFFLSDCLRNGQLPLWLPYQLGGSPFYADPQSGAWYPVAWLFCALAPYTLKSFAIEYIVTISIGGFGIYRLCKGFELRPSVGLIAAVSFCASGFFISGAEYFSWVVSAAWTPWIFWAYHRMMQTQHWRYALLCGIFLFLLLSGGYPAFIAVNGYLLILFFLLDFFTRQRNGSRGRILLLNGLIAVVFLSLSAGPLWSWYQVNDYITRGAALSLEDVNNGPFSPRCLESLLLPFVTLKGDEIYRTDISMRNAYFGLLALSTLPFALLRAKDRRLWVILIISLICLAAAMGDYLPVRKFFYDYVPTMRHFRLPALFRLYSIIGFLMLGAVGLEALLRSPEKFRKRWTLAGLLLLAVTVSMLLVSVFKHGFTWNWGWRGRSFKENYFAAARFENMQLQAIMQTGLLVLLLIGINIGNRRIPMMRLLFAFCCVDLAIATALNAFGTLVYIEPFEDLAKHIREVPRRFEPPDATLPVASVTDSSRQLGLLRVNTSIYFKYPAADGYNSFLLKTYTRFKESGMVQIALRAPYLHFASALVSEDSTAGIKSSEVGVVILKDTDLASLPPYTRNTATAAVHVTEFRPGRVRAAVDAPEGGVLNLQQAPVPGWAVRIDGKPGRLMQSNINQQAVIVPPGEHLISWDFNPQGVKLFYALCGSLLLLYSGLLIAFRNTAPRSPVNCVR